MQKQNPVQETDLRREGYGKGPEETPGPIGHFLGFSAIRFRGAGTPRLASERSATSSFYPKTNPVLCRTILHFFAGA